MPSGTTFAISNCHGDGDGDGDGERDGDGNAAMMHIPKNGQPHSGMVWSVSLYI